jgi:hypothetical protein
LAAGVVAAAQARAALGPVRLRRLGRERPLPSRWLGYNAPANYDIPVEDPAFRSAVKRIAPHYLRFPGGTVANYYQPQTGQLDFGNDPHGSGYRKFLQAQAAPAARRLHPKGVAVEQYIDFAREIEAGLIVLPNLESSSTAVQAEWFRRMNHHGFKPDRVEMGNEFYLALLMGPVTLGVFPDWATTLRRTRTYLEAIRPFLAKDALIAVQAASSKLHDPFGRATDARSIHERQWDRDMRPEPWFQAVTSHVYPTIEGSAGAGSLKGLPGDVGRVYPAMLARADEGFDRSIADTVARMPDKEVWITEWGAFEPASTFDGAPVVFDGMWLHMIARGALAMLRHKEVTVSTPHALFAQGNLMSAFRRTGAPVVGAAANDLGGRSPAPGGPGGGYAPINATGVLAWIAEASRGPDAHYQRLMAQGARRITAHGTVPGEAFADVDACLFRRGRTHTLFVHNAWSAPRCIDLADVTPTGAATTADLVETPDLLANLQGSAPAARSLAAGAAITVPAHALMRIRWNS